MNSKHLRKALLSLIPLALIASAAMLHLSSPTGLDLLRLKVFDTYQRLAPRVYEPLPVSIVDIDEESLKRLGQWPWSRDTLANLTNRLSALGVAATGYDIVFAETDRTSPSILLPTWKGFLGQPQIQNVPDYDRLFAEAITTSNVVTGFVLSDTVFDTPVKKFGLVTKGESVLDYLYPYAGAVSSLPMLTKAAQGNGALNAIPDQDGLIRKVPLFLRVRDQFYPGLAAETLRIAQGASTYIMSSTIAGVEQVKIGEFDIPTDKHGHVWIHYTPYQHSRYIPAWEIMEEGFDAARLEGHLVLIGTSAAGLKDIRSTPLAPVTNGVEVHAQLLEQILLGHYLYRPDWIETAELLGMVVTALGVWLLVARTSPYIGALGTAIVLSAGLIGSWISFRDFHLLVDPVSPSLVILLVYLTESLRGYISSEQQRRQVRHAFSHYMSPALVEKLAEQPESLKLGGEIKEMTILFCDIRGFTTISEQFDAQGLTQFINRFLTPMTDIILNHQGTIDKYMGDCIMAFWNAPLNDDHHAQHGCRAALSMIHGLHLLNAERETEAKSAQAQFIPVQIGIGLNTDKCCVGNMGSDQRFDYSVLGDGVNLASRLEGQSKYYGMTIVIGEQTQQAIPDFATLELDLIKVKGKTEAVRIYGLLGDETLAQQAEWQMLERDNRLMLNAYRHREWNPALDYLNAMQATVQRLDLSLQSYLELYRERIADYQHNPPPEGWDGVYVALSK